MIITGYGNYLGLGLTLSPHTSSGVLSQPGGSTSPTSSPTTQNRVLRMASTPTTSPTTRTVLSRSVISQPTVSSPALVQPTSQPAPTAPTPSPSGGSVSMRQQDMREPAPSTVMERSLLTMKTTPDAPLLSPGAPMTMAAQMSAPTAAGGPATQPPGQLPTQPPPPGQPQQQALMLPGAQQQAPTGYSMPSMYPGYGPGYGPMYQQPFPGAGCPAGTVEGKDPGSCYPIGDQYRVPNPFAPQPASPVSMSVAVPGGGGGGSSAGGGATQDTSAAADDELMQQLVPTSPLAKALPFAIGAAALMLLMR